MLSTYLTHTFVHVHQRSHDNETRKKNVVHTAILIDAIPNVQIKVCIFDETVFFCDSELCFRCPNTLSVAAVPRLVFFSCSSNPSTGIEPRISKRVIIFHPLALYAYNNLLLDTCFALSLHRLIGILLFCLLQCANQSIDKYRNILIFHLH